MSGTIAVGSLVDIGFLAESTFGTTPVSTAFQSIRDVAFNLNLEKETYQSEERRSDRMRQDVRHGYRSVTGDITGELSAQSWDAFIEAIMGGTWAAGASSNFTSVVANSGTSRFTVTSANFPTNGFRVGDVFAVTGTPAVAGLHDRLFTALSVGVSTIEVEPGTIGTTVTGSCVIATFGRKVSVGNTYRSFTIERWLTDKTLYQQFRGIRFNQMTINVPASGMVGITFSVMGQDGTGFAGSTVASTYTAQVQTTPFAAVNGELYEGGSVLGVVTSAEITINNNMAGPQTVGRETYVDMLWGRYVDVTGTISVLFVDATAHNKFVNETESSLILRLQDVSSLTSSTAFIQVTLPRIKYTGGAIDDSPDTGITVTMPFIALKPLAANTAQGTSSIVIQRSNT
jgi:hypothetical protein